MALGDPPGDVGSSIKQWRHRSHLGCCNVCPYNRNSLPFHQRVAVFNSRQGPYGCNGLTCSAIRRASHTRNLEGRSSRADWPTIARRSWLLTFLTPPPSDGNNGRGDHDDHDVHIDLIHLEVARCVACIPLVVLTSSRMSAAH
jgi:hypothetical protein